MFKIANNGWLNWDTLTLAPCVWPILIVEP